MPHLTFLSSLPSSTSLFFIGAIEKEQTLFVKRFLDAYLPHAQYEHIERFHTLNHHLTNVRDGFFILASEASLAYQLIIQHIGDIGSLGFDGDFVVGYNTKEYFICQGRS
ncbi:hypothetical protein [Sulfurospirillum deleyianum]|uniref:Uncharacterized protein n=1 Tax=Sulfurospirillum deleyianum (strain ATCC 51133 / DSM 6946 / 5175) TaxID=525898 RepID=D1B1I4_SULD5|nr:hypothetical protein [Sulfurospirillum deleyianum]ACZ11954.1 hypothetical protein Sdel_0924 [Sulfurospirillum deleyianum DSM 6946]